MFILKIVDHDFLNSPNTELDYPQTTADVLDTLTPDIRVACAAKLPTSLAPIQCAKKSSYSPAIDFRYMNATLTYS